MSQRTASVMQNAMAGGAVGALLASGLFAALPAAAEVSGYDTGYQYRQGLAIGAGGELMTDQATAVSTAPDQSISSAPTPITVNETAIAPAGNQAAVVESAPAAASEQAAAPATSAFLSAIGSAWALGSLLLLALLALLVWAFANRDHEVRHTHRPAYH